MTVFSFSAPLYPCFSTKLLFFREKNGVFCPRLSYFVQYFSRAFYLGIVKNYWRSDFPELALATLDLSNGFDRTIVPLMIYRRSRLGTATGIEFIDSTSLKVCHNRRIFSHRVFKELAQRGKTLL